MSLVSIILTTLNSERFLAQSLESCLRQTHSEIELLVVDGGSTDRTLEIVSLYEDPRIRLIHQPGNLGKLPGAINLGMANSQGEFITWTQSDCWYEPHAIETMLSFVEAHPGIAFVYTDYWEMDESGKRIWLRVARPPEDCLMDDVVGVCFLFRRHVYEELGPQALEHFPVHEVEWGIRVYRKFPIMPLHKPLLNYIVHGGSLTGQIGAWELQRLSARTLLNISVLDQRHYQIRLAQIDVNEAFEAFILRGDFERFWKRSISGILRNPAWLGNRGLLRLFAIYFLPQRETRQKMLAHRWYQDHQKSHFLDESPS